MSMSRKDFQKMADVVNGLDLSLEQKKTVALGLAGVCAEANDRFDEDKFLKACGVVVTSKAALSLNVGDRLLVAGIPTMITNMHLLNGKVEVRTAIGRSIVLPVAKYVQVLAA